jgi:capsular polysaccharide biosynthesis protein
MSPLLYRYPEQRNSPQESSCEFISLFEISESRFLKAPAFDGHLCRDMYGDLPFGLHVLSGVRLCGNPGYFFSKSGRALLEQNAGFLRKKKFLRHRIEQAAAPGQPVHIFPQALSLLSSCHHYFWHWVMDCLPKVFLAEECGFQGTYIIPPLQHGAFILESMRFLGIPDSRMHVSQGELLFAEELFIPSYFCGYNAHHNGAFIRAYRDWIFSFIQQDKTQASSHFTSENILIGRRPNAAFRQLLNQDAIEQALLPFGFHTIYFEDYPFLEQIRLAQNTRILFGTHGSGLTQALFMPEGSLVLEFFPKGRVQSCDCYETLCSIFGHHYIALESELERSGHVKIKTSLLLGVLGNKDNK